MQIKRTLRLVQVGFHVLIAQGHAAPRDEVRSLLVHGINHKACCIPAERIVIRGEELGAGDCCKTLRRIQSIEADKAILVAETKVAPAGGETAIRKGGLTLLKRHNRET